MNNRRIGTLFSITEHKTTEAFKKNKNMANSKLIQKIITNYTVIVALTTKKICRQLMPPSPALVRPSPVWKFALNFLPLSHSPSPAQPNSTAVQFFLSVLTFIIIFLLLSFIPFPDPPPSFLLLQEGTKGKLHSALSLFCSI